LAKLKGLLMRNCRLDGDAIAELAPGLAQLSELEALHLGGNDFGAEGMAVLADEALPHMGKLKVLDLRVFPSRLHKVAAGHLARGLANLEALRELDISYCGLTAASMLQIAPSFCYLVDLARLKLRSNELGERGAQALATEGLPYVKQLKVLDISRCVLTPEGVQELAPGIAHLRGLETLLLEGNECGTKGAQALATDAFPHLANLKELDVAACGLKAAAAKLLAPGLEHLRALEVLVLRGNDFGTAAAELIGPALLHLIGLKVLDLKNCELTRPAAEALTPGLSQLRHLKVLDLKDRKLASQFTRAMSFGKEAWTPQLESFKALDLESSGGPGTFLMQLMPGLGLLSALESLNLKNNTFGANGTEVLASQGLSKLLGLRDLNLTDCSFGSADLHTLAPILGKLINLETLSLRGNEFGSTGVRTLTESTLPHLARLKEFVLAFCELDEDCLQELAPGLRQLRGLERLIIPFNDFGEGGAEHLAREAFPGMVNLKELNVANCGLGPGAMQKLTPGLRHLSGLQKLVVSSNEFGSEGARALAEEVFPHCPALREFEASYCGINGTWPPEFAPGLGSCCNLERLDLMANHVGVEAAKEFATKTFPNATKLRELNLSYCGLQAAELVELTPGFKDLADLEILNLRNNTALGIVGAEALANGILPFLKKLKTVDLRICSFYEEAVEMMAPSLSQLDELEAVDFGDKKLIVVFIKALARDDGRPAPKLRMYRELLLDQCDIGGELMRELAPGLRLLRDLEHLSLRGNNLDVEAATALATALPHLERLKDLHIAHCELTPDGVQALAPALGQCVGLEVLNIMNNQVSAQGAEALIAEALPHLMLLREFNVTNTDTSVEMKSAMEYWLPGADVMITQ